MELFDRERMWHYLSLLALENEVMIERLEKHVRNGGDTYCYLSSYLDKPREKFRIIEGDRSMLFQIARLLKEKSIKDFKPSNKPSPPANSGYKLLDLLNYHIYSRSSRYSNELKEICLLVYLKGGKVFILLYFFNFKWYKLYLSSPGPSLYEVLSWFLPIPSQQTVKRHLGDIENVDEGVIRAKELKRYLVSHQFPCKVWLSEDATRSIAHVSPNILDSHFIVNLGICRICL